MSKLLTLGILQQAQNGQGGSGSDGVLYDGEMTVGSAWGYVGFLDFGANPGSVDPTVNGWTYCHASEIEDGMDLIYSFDSNYPDIGSVLAHYEFGGTVYTSTQSLFTYLYGQSGNTISLKIYEDAQ